LDLAGFTATIQVADGTYTAGLNVASSPVGGNVALVGNATTPANCIISTTGGDAIMIGAAVNLSLSGFKLQTTTSGNAINATVSGANITISGLMNFGSCAGVQIRAVRGGNVSIASPYTISGGGTVHYQSAQSGVIAGANQTITLTGTPGFTTFADANTVAFINLFGFTFSGSATGTRYSVALNGAINTFGSGGTFFPGNAAGATTTGGVYA
jgi:hypothetical protein